MHEPDGAAVALGAELQPGQGVDRDGIRRNASNVAQSVSRAGLPQQRADAIAEPGQVRARDRSADRERDRVRRAHRPFDRPVRRDSSSVTVAGDGCHRDVRLRLSIASPYG
jgi:hypothetical protein